ncbi:MAG: SDR family NAD(P)-dependent oxidoreductase [Sphaerochaetaceae bacterium]|jgi:3-oxoacyl-[acyl-carrier protein] reductase|nr:SDR family NAD(P)-dependent oxidoreductase [Sphaerochaetaceae bacterium]
MRLKDKIAVITGSGRGIGKAIADVFAEEGAYVVLVDRSGSDAAANEILQKGLKAEGMDLDITDPAAVKAGIDGLLQRKGKIDILVNNAGIISREAFVDLSYETWNKILDVNVNGNFNMCKAIIPSMIDRHYGKIVNISSIAGKMGDITASAAYGTSKGAVNAFTKSLARQLAQHSINVNAVAPHAIETDMSAQWPKEKRENVLSGIPLHRMGSSKEVAYASLFLASDEAAFITGEILNLNGGALMD